MRCVVCTGRWAGITRPGSVRFTDLGRQRHVAIAGSGLVQSMSTAMSEDSNELGGQKQSSKAQERMSARLLATESALSSVSYRALPQLWEAPDLLHNPRLAALVVPIPPHLLAPFYASANAHNARLEFFCTGQPDDATVSHYVRSFMPHCQQPHNRFYIKSDHASPALSASQSSLLDSDILPWQPLSALLRRVFGAVGVDDERDFRDFYTHILPAHNGRHNPHKDQLQAGTWKVDIRMCSEWSELLILDEADGRWYALRFPPGGSGYVIDSLLFTRFHAVRAGVAVQQSVLAVFNKQASTAPMLRSALAQLAQCVPNPTPFLSTFPMNVEATTMRKGNAVGAVTWPFAGAPAKTGAANAAALTLTPLTLPLAPLRHPRAVENARVAAQNAQHVRNCLQWLRTAVLAAGWDGFAQESVNDADLSANNAGDAHELPTGWLSRIPRAVIDKALEKGGVPPDVGADVRTIYENRCKRVQHVISGAQAYTPARRHARIQVGKKIQRVLDDRMVSITGTATVGDDTVVFGPYDGTDSTRLRFAWRAGTVYHQIGVSTESGNFHARNLALLAKRLNLRFTGTTAYRVSLRFVGDEIVGSTAALLRKHGLSLQVVHLHGEPDHSTKRTLELERQSQRVRRVLKKKHATRPKQRLSAFNYFAQDHRKLEQKTFKRLSPAERKVYQDKAKADQQRYQTELSHMPTPPKFPLPAFAIFAQENPEAAKGQKDRISSLAKAFARLSPADKQVYLAKAAVDRARYQEEMNEWHAAHPEGYLKRQRSSWMFFLQEYRSSAKKKFDQLNPEEKQPYEDQSVADRHRFEKQLSAWSAANSKAPVTAFEVFQAEIGPSLLQRYPDKYLGREGLHTLSRELRAQWHHLSPAAWSQYEDKLQSRYEQPNA